jgi:t-SNARE complex subunit (syntaxin)
MYEVQFSAAPNDYTKNIIEGTPTLIDGKYYQNWIQTDATESEIEQRLEDKWFEIREIRNQLLMECDWTQLSDISTEIKNLWSNYRQDLRDITNQTNPFNITWPVKP